ncbi:DnaJ domain-containing protein [Apiosordaria backusii]|uniref:DnaJ domain-containing protein n=1 Tax=Apiosordaria backusii TaxID=314023 RepID=A0AA40EFQ5_9PEZI|nr:DnaJ domain-containing protein [Apiosordaria backusii]
MPFRYYHPPRGAIPRIIANPSHNVSFNNNLQPRRPFHSSRHDRAASNPDDSTHDHYETLNIQPNATPAEIKKSYFHLSKLHHPDHNPSDPSSSHRFMRISEAYIILSHPQNRARSPPSFYRSGGWGSHAAKRRAAHESSTAQPGSPEGKTHHPPHQQNTQAKDHPGWAGTGGPESNPGMGFGQDPYYKYGFGGFGYGTNTGSNPFFDPDSHTRTHKRGDERRARRAMKRRGLSLDADDNMLGTFFVLSGCVVASVLGAMVIGGMGGGIGR